MRVGICAYDMPARRLLEIAVAADGLGFDALWLGEHVVLPFGYESEHPTHAGAKPENEQFPTIIDPLTELLDPWVFLGAVAASTKRLRLATGMYIAPLRHPLITARAAATLHEVSDGRFMLGVGTGWLREEFAALDVPFDERGSRLDEIIQILRLGWRGGPFEFHGTHFDLGPVQVSPRPMEIPLVLGGNTGPALRRAAVGGDAWFSSGMPSCDDSIALHQRLLAIRAARGLSDDLRCYVRVDLPDADRFAQYEAAGIHDAVLWAHQLCPPGANVEESMARAAARFGLQRVPR